MLRAPSATSPTSLQTAHTALLILYEALCALEESLVYLYPQITHILGPLNSLPFSLVLLLVHYNI